LGEKSFLQILEVHANTKTYFFCNRNARTGRRGRNGASAVQHAEWRRVVAEGSALMAKQARLAAKATQLNSATAILTLVQGCDFVAMLV